MKRRLGIAKRMAYVVLGVMLVLVWLLFGTDLFDVPVHLSARFVGPPPPPSGDVLPTINLIGWESYVGGALGPLLFYGGKRLVDLGIAILAQKKGIEL